MPNIMINSYCNLKCPYCFADNEITDCSTKNMSVEDFKKIIKWHKDNGIEIIRLIGGEPTLHPNFPEFLNEVLKDDFLQGVHIFSNMTFGENVKNSLINFSFEKRLSFLPNFNEENVIGEKYELVKKNIRNFGQLGTIECLGVNIYKNDYDFTEIINLANEIGALYIRWAIVTPNYKIDDSFNVKKYFNGYYDVLLRFFKICNENHLGLSQDCNSIPMCSFTDKQLKNLLMHNPKLFAKDLACDVVLDINPKMEIFRCFGLSDDYKTKFDENAHIDYYKEVISTNTRTIEEKILFDECKSCEVYKFNGDRSCACINYRKDR